MSKLQTLTALASLLLVLPVFAQTPPVADPPVPQQKTPAPPQKSPVPKEKSPPAQGQTQDDLRKEEIRNRIQDYREKMRDGKLLRTHVKVRVNLRNGERMAGVVRDGLFVEKPDGLEFARAEMTAKGAGLRLWYYDQTDGYIFIPYTLIESYKVLARLSDVEIAEIRDKIVEQERLAREKGAERKQQLEAKQQELREGKDTEKKLAEVSKKLVDEQKAKEREQRLLALLEEFPPSEGWGPERIKEIELRRIAIKVFPNPKERRFIDVFDDWKEGLRVRQEQEKLKAQGPDLKRDADKGPGEKDGKPPVVGEPPPPPPSTGK